ncbi:Response regulator receiver protein [Enhygromyxa salina]|uniref:Response regulator receiver protein n=1 Tax=Enhygromyxa salina TaxID=215803 RepID=A0A2S9YFQ9_9BACT|nr:response regulator [Enhygromyxa salina]PRQ03882.1 Response regulator receiver protein [Enhygromyxa salina]
MTRPQPSVLVIDDNTDLAENIGEILSDIGVDVHLATCADDAMACFDDRKWSLVVTDVRMPGIDGIELLALIKERSPGTPVLVMTGYADRETTARAHDSGALAVINKPVDLDALLEMVEHVAAAEKPVLVLEDDVALIGNLTDLLREEQGVLPHPATNLALARKLAAVVDFRAALIDLRLPDGNGLALARELLRRSDGSRRRVIIITGYPEELSQAVRDDAQIDDDRLVVLAKPFQVPNLLEYLREMV